MTERVAYVNGRLVPESQATISVFDRGVQWGDAVYDAARTFGLRPFRMRDHIDRLYRSCTYTRMPIRLTPDDLEKKTREVLDHNLPLVPTGDDAMIWWSVTRGVSGRSRSALDCAEATVIIYTFPVPFAEFAGRLTEGARVVTPAIRRTPPQCLDPRAKISNKMNHILADLEVKGADRGASSLMLDLDGYLAENSGSNFFFVRQGRICTSGRSTVLAGVTRTTIMELADGLRVPVDEGNFTVYDVYTADEAFMTTTSYCIMPVVSLKPTRSARSASSSPRPSAGSSRCA